MAYVAPAAAVGDIFLLTFDGFMFGQKLINTFYYRLEELPVAASVFAVGTTLKGYVVAAGGLKDKFKAIVPENYLLNNIWVQKVSPFRIVKQVFTVAESGSPDQHTVTANIGATIERRGDDANKHNIGSLHVPMGDSADWMDSGLITATGLVLLSTLGSKMVETLGTPGATTTFAPVLARKAPGAWIYQYITATIPQLTARVMRRRTVGVGK